MQAESPQIVRPSPKVTLKRVVELAWPERWSIATGTFFLLVGSVANLAFPKAAGSMIDAALGNLLRDSADTSVIDRWAVILTSIFALQGIAVAIRFSLFSRVGERVVNRLRAQLFQALLEQDTGFFDSQKTGDLSSRLSSDATALQGTVSSSISMMLRNATTALGTLVMLLVTSKTLTMLMLTVVPPVALAAVYYGRKVRKLGKEVQDALAQSNGVAVESLSGIRTVRSFAAEKIELKRYREAIDSSLGLSFRRIRFSAAFMGGASFSSYAAGSLVFWYGGRMVAQGDLTTGELTSFLMYTMMLAFSMASLAELYTSFQQAAGAADRVFELLHRTPAILPSGGRSLSHVGGGVEFKDVVFAYPSRRDVIVLRNFSLQLEPGRVVALVGPSGAGKSTIASLLYRLYDPSSGRVSIDGVDIRELNPDWLRQQIGVVAQEPLLFSTSILENIRYGRPGASDVEVEEAAKWANAYDFIHAFPEKFQTLVGERGIQLSGGQKQRVAIARAVLKNPRILILDEATSALDAESEHLVREALERLMKGRTTLIIAHRLSTVQGADRVVVLEAGTVAQSGTHATLAAEEGLYRRLILRQFAA